MGKDIFVCNHFPQTKTALGLFPWIHQKEQKNFPWQFLNWKVWFICSLRWLGHACHSSSCRGSIIAFHTEITQVAEVEPQNVVWMSLSAIRKRSKIWLCLLPSHSSTLSDTPIPTRLHKLLDKVRKSAACYQLGTLWCTSCWRNALKHLP